MNEQRRIRIGIVGAGAIGSFYGLQMARAGHDVHFLLRSNYADIKANGLTLRSAELGDFHLANPNVYQNPEDMPACDWLFLASKTTANKTIGPVISQLAKPGSHVLILQNGLSVEDSLKGYLAPSVHVLGGLCIVSVHRGEPGVINHYGLGSVNIGYHSGPTGTREEARQVLDACAQLFKSANLQAPICEDLVQARWQKLVMNVPFNGLSVVLGSGTQPMMQSPSTRALIRELMQEVCDAAAACGHPLPDDYLDQAWSATDGKPDYQPSMALDYQNGRPLELDAIYAAPLAAAARVNFPMPKVNTLYRLLKFLDERA
ncbi:2-dehydropantoate 2-reductase [compost metagenome]